MSTKARLRELEKWLRENPGATLADFLKRPGSLPAKRQKRLLRAAPRPHGNGR